MAAFGDALKFFDRQTAMETAMFYQSVFGDVSDPDSLARLRLCDCERYGGIAAFFVVLALLFNGDRIEVVRQEVLEPGAGSHA